MDRKNKQVIRKFYLPRILLLKRRDSWILNEPSTLPAKRLLPKKERESHKHKTVEIKISSVSEGKLQKRLRAPYVPPKIQKGFTELSTPSNTILSGELQKKLAKLSGYNPNTKRKASKVPSQKLRILALMNHHFSNNAQKHPVIQEKIKGVLRKMNKP